MLNSKPSSSINAISFKLIIVVSSLYRFFVPDRVFYLDISSVVLVIHCYVAFVLVFFSDNWMAVLCYVIESTGVMLAVFGYAFAKQRTFVVKKSETGNLVVRVSDFSD